MTIAYITHPVCRLHDMGEAHPESPARLAAIEDQLLASGLELALRRYDAPEATREQLLRVHDPHYLDALAVLAPTAGLQLLDADTAMNPHTLEAARYAAGAVVMAVDLVLGGAATSAFCAVRPPGHHAGRASAMGCCFYNNIAVGAAYALAQHGLQRIALVDFDVHHGNGTEDIFREEPRVLFCSAFQHPFFPHSDIGVHAAHIIRTPLDAGTGSVTFRERIAGAWLPALDAFAPELVMVSAGFDAHWQDDLADLNLNESDYRWLTAELCELAARHAGGRIISVLEGGYVLPVLARSVAAHLDALLG